MQIKSTKYDENDEKHRKNVTKMHDEAIREQKSALAGGEGGWVRANGEWLVFIVRLRTWHHRQRMSPKRNMPFL